MERKTFKSLYYRWIDKKEYLQRLLHQKQFSKMVRASTVDSVKRSIAYYERQLEEFGLGDVIYVTGSTYGWENHLKKPQKFYVILVNTNLEEAREFIQIQVKNIWNFVNPKTLNYKSLKTRELVLL